MGSILKPLHELWQQEDGSHLSLLFSCPKALLELGWACVQLYLHMLQVKLWVPHLLKVATPRLLGCFALKAGAECLSEDGKKSEARKCLIHKLWKAVVLNPRF